MSKQKIRWDVENLKESPEFLRGLLESLNSAILLVDKDRQVRSFNAFFSKIFQVEDEPAPDARCGEILKCRFVEDEGRRCGETSQCSQCPLKAAVEALMAQGEELDRVLLTREFFLGGEMVEKHLVCSVRQSSFHGEILATLIIDDVTDIETQRRELEDLNAVKNNFLGMAAHDLRNPLSVIRTYTQLMRSEKIGKLSDIQSRVIDNTEHAAANMLRLVNDLLDVAAIESGALELDIQPTEIEPWLRDFVEQQELLASSKNMHIELEVWPDLPKVSMDAGRMAQVLENLVTNAVKYSPQGSTIRVSAGIDNQQLVMSVHDEGPGIKPAEQDKLFKNFSRTSNIPTGNEVSTGLGLAIVKRIVTAHDGQVGVESIPGSGSTFYCTLPL